MRVRWRRSGCATLVAAAAAPAAATASTRGRGGLGGDAIAITGGGSEDRELHAGFLAGALGAGDFLLPIYDDLFFLRIRRPPRAPLFPYTALFRAAAAPHGLG